MNERATASKDPDIMAAAKALRRAARRALEIGLSTGTPVYALRAGRIVDLTQEAAPRSPLVEPMAAHEAGASYGAGSVRRRK